MWSPSTFEDHLGIKIIYHDLWGHAKNKMLCPLGDLFVSHSSVILMFIFLVANVNTKIKLSYIVLYNGERISSFIILVLVNGWWGSAWQHNLWALLKHIPISATSSEWNITNFLPWIYEHIWIIKRALMPWFFLWWRNFPSKLIWTVMHSWDLFQEPFLSCYE